MDESDKIIKELHIEASQLLAQKFSDEAIVSALMKRGIDMYYAETILQNAKEDKSDRKEFYRLLLGGLFVFSAGLATSIISYFYTFPGGLYFVFTGIMVYGIFAITRAFVIFKK